MATGAVGMFFEQLFWLIILIVYLVGIATVATGWYEDFIDSKEDE